MEDETKRRIMVYIRLYYIYAKIRVDKGKLGRGRIYILSLKYVFVVIVVTLMLYEGKGY